MSVHVFGEAHTPLAYTEASSPALSTSSLSPALRSDATTLDDLLTYLAQAFGYVGRSNLGALGVHDATELLELLRRASRSIN